MGRQGEGHLRVQHSVGGNEGEIVHGVFVFCVRVGDHGSDGHLAAGPGGGGHGVEGGDPPQDPEQALQPVQAPVGIGDPGAHGLGAVHAGPAAEGDQRLTALPDIHFPGLLHIVDRGVGPGAVIHGAVNAGLRQQGFQGGGAAQTAQVRVRHQQHGSDAVRRQLRRDVRQMLQDRGLPVRPQGDGQPEHRLHRPAHQFFQGIHASGRPSSFSFCSLAVMDSSAS